MTYASRTDLEQRYGADEVAQRESVLTAGAVDRALLDADAFINGYLATKYTLPLSTVPDNLPQVAAVIARYDLLGDAATERARDDYKDAVAWLKDIQAGRVQLQAAMPVPGNAPSMAVMVSGGQSVFKRTGRP